jgi:hypothetical protein
MGAYTRVVRRHEVRDEEKRSIRRGMVLPFDHQTYIFFLERSDFQPGASERAAAHGELYMPAFMSRGLYLIDGGVVQPRTFPGHPLAKAYAGKSETVLENDILDIVENRAHDGREPR